MLFVPFPSLLPLLYAFCRSYVSSTPLYAVPFAPFLLSSCRLLSCFLSFCRVFWRFYKTNNVFKRTKTVKSAQKRDFSLHFLSQTSICYTYLPYMVYIPSIYTSYIHYIYLFTLYIRSYIIYMYFNIITIYTVIY